MGNVSTDEVFGEIQANQDIWAHGRWSCLGRCVDFGDGLWTPSGLGSCGSIPGSLGRSPWHRALDQPSAEVSRDKPIVLARRTSPALDFSPDLALLRGIRF